MKKYFNLSVLVLLLIIINTAALKASIIDELNYVNEKSDFYGYINFSQILTFISSRGIDLNELDTLVMDGSTSESDKIIKEFGLKLSDMNELLIVMNTQDLEKKSGYLILMSFKNGKGIVPENFKKSSVNLKSGIAYKASAEDDIVFTRIDDFFVIGSTDYVDKFTENRSSGKSNLSSGSSFFIKKLAARSVFFNLTVSDYIKTSINTAMNSNAGMSRGLKENVFIQTLLSLSTIDWGMEMSDKILFQSGMQGSKSEDSERLMMLSHTWIVGSSFVVSFADLMAARSGDQKLTELTSDQQLMSWMHKAFGRIHVKQEDKGVVVSFEMTAGETDLMISFLKKEMEKEKIARAERMEREKISRLTQAVTENNLEKVQNFIKEKYNINGFDTDGNTPLGVAALNGNVKMARLLIEKGAGLNIPDIDKLTPLQQAVKTEQKEMVTFLLTKGGDVNAKADTGVTALHINAMQGSSEITRILLAKGALINAADSDGSTALHHAASGGFLDIVKVLVEKKANPELLNSSGQRAIDVAAQNGQTPVVDFLKIKFKQEPKGFSSEEYNLNNEKAPANDDGDDSIIENEEVE